MASNAISVGIKDSEGQRIKAGETSMTLLTETIQIAGTIEMRGGKGALHGSDESDLWDTGW
jgi:hypothetical protein